MTRGLFITGTDTEVGKTVIAAGILRRLRAQGMDAISAKPVQTGAVFRHGKLIAEDLEFHHAAADLKVTEDDLADMAPYLYEPACSPHLAGRLAGSYPEIDRIASCVENLKERHACVIVEGAGGVMTPVNEDATMLDLMQRLAFPVILVAPRGLGAINQSLLCIEAIRRCGLTLAGIVFNEAEDVEEDYIRKDNPEFVRAFARVDLLGNVGYLGPMKPESDEFWEPFVKGMTGMDRILEICAS